MMAVLLSPASKVSAAEKKTAPNGITTLSEDFYNAVISAAKNGTFAKLHAASDERSNVEVKATRFAIAGSDGTNPYVLVTAYDPKDKSGWCTESMLAETTYIYTYDEGTGSFLESGIRISNYARNSGMNDGYKKENLYLDNRSSKYDFATFSVYYGRYTKDDICTVTEYGKSDRLGHQFEATQKTVSNYLKKGTFTKIKWYKLSSITAFKKAYKGVVKKAVTKGAKDDRDTYYAKKGSPLSYLKYKIPNGTMTRTKYTDKSTGEVFYTYTFDGVTEQDTWEVHKGIKADVYASDGAATTDYYYYYIIEGKKVIELDIITSYIDGKHSISVTKHTGIAGDHEFIADFRLNVYGSMNDADRSKIESMSDVEFINYLKKNFPDDCKG